MFYLDLDELDFLAGKLWMFGYNQANWFNFRDHDHLKFPLGSTNGRSLKQNVLEYLRNSGIELDGGRVMLLTNVRTLGYGFNPISVYLCFDKLDAPVCSVAEVCNTHGEMKLYLLDKGNFDGGIFRRMVPKLFYVSPFASLASSFEFIFSIPDESLTIRVDDYEDQSRFLLSRLTGKRKAITNLNLFGYALRFPFITLKIIFLIYWQAFVLYLKRIPFNRKHVDPHLQKEAYQYKKV